MKKNYLHNHPHTVMMYTVAATLIVPLFIQPIHAESVDNKNFSTTTTAATSTSTSTSTLTTTSSDSNRKNHNQDSASLLYTTRNVFKAKTYS
jgi:hypothetical protein